MKTIRDIIYEYQSEIAKGNLLPVRAGEIVTQLSALVGNCNEAIREADYKYNLVLLRHLEGEEKANRAKIRAECSKEYLDKREARDAKELVIEMIRSLKYLLRSYEEEIRTSANL